MKKKIILSTLFITAILLLITGGNSTFQTETQIKQAFGSPIDSYNGVTVYYYGNGGKTKHRNLSKDGYNFGLKYECTEFVKRYYYVHFNHNMPVTYGNAKDFYNNNIKDGQRNIQRDLIQYSNPSRTKPKEGDLIIFPSNKFNHFGHVAIISKVTNNEIEVVQQNMGLSTRATYGLLKTDNGWEVKENFASLIKINPLGWLRK